MPQIIMLNHASWVNGKRMEARIKVTTETKQKQEEEDPIVWNGKRLSEMTSDEMSIYYGGL